MDLGKTIQKNPLQTESIKMINNEIRIEIEMKDSTSMFAVKKMIGYRTLRNDNFQVKLQLADEEKVNRNSLLFLTNLEGFEDVARIIEGIHETNLGMQEKIESEED